MRPPSLMIARATTIHILQWMKLRLARKTQRDASVERINRGPATFSTPTSPARCAAANSSLSKSTSSGVAANKYPSSHSKSQSILSRCNDLADLIDRSRMTLRSQPRSFGAVQFFDLHVTIVVGIGSRWAVVRPVMPPPIKPSSKTTTERPSRPSRYAVDKPAIPGPDDTNIGSNTFFLAEIAMACLPSPSRWMCLACESSSSSGVYFEGVPMLTSIRLSPPNQRPPNTNNAATTRITKITRTAMIPVLAVLLPLSAISFLLIDLSDL